MSSSEPCLSTIVYVSEIAPVDTQASSVLIFRHLRALEREGYRICVVTLAIAVKPGDLPSTWQLIALPPRKPYYPPYRPQGLLRRLRWHLLDRIVRPALTGQSIQCVISLLQGEYLVGYAAWLSQRLSTPLFCFYHDRGERLHHWGNPAGAERLRRQNLAVLATPTLQRVWTVTPELNYELPSLADKFLTVYPLPEAYAERAPLVWRDTLGRAPILAYAGSIYDQVIEPMRQLARELSTLGGRLLLYSHLAETARRLEQEFPGIVTYEGNIRGAQQLCTIIREKSSAFVVAYPAEVSAMPWCLDCFPSKFSQLVQSGLPGLVISPPETAIARWCLQHNWSLFADASDLSGVRQQLQSLTQRESWERALAQTREAAAEDFLPSHIEQLVNGDVRQACQSSPPPQS
ncbi:MAG TPA: hypothetical protein PK879_08515 [Opitutaceae bacterium]|jgi:hypothetical protein|nr:hypothetical protein [Opitutaceae bacterium]HPO00737.1 hypothetical protein [Opitutaceae bacterium]